LQFSKWYFENHLQKRNKTVSKGGLTAELNSDVGADYQVVIKRKKPK
jgi:hypothetical protein